MVPEIKRSTLQSQKCFRILSETDEQMWIRAKD